LSFAGSEWTNWCITGDEIQPTAGEEDIVKNVQWWVDQMEASRAMKDLGLTEYAVPGDLMFIQLKSRRLWSVYRLEVRKGKKVFEKVPRRLWDEKIRAEIAMKILERGRGDC